MHWQGKQGEDILAADNHENHTGSGLFWLTEAWDGVVMWT